LEPAARIRKRKSRAVQRLREAFFARSHTTTATATSHMGADVSSEERQQMSEASEHRAG
jgi:hypothetical protein